MTVPGGAPEGGFAMSVFLLSSSTLGGGILTLASAAAQTGWAFNAIVMLLTALATLYSIYLLIYLGRFLKADSYEDLGAILFPKYGRQVVAGVTQVLMFGFLVGYVDIISDSLLLVVQDLLKHQRAESSALHTMTTRNLFVPLYMFIFVFPLCCMTSIHHLEKPASTAVFIIAGFAMVVLVNCLVEISSNRIEWREVDAFTFSTGVFDSLSVVCVSFSCQMTIFPIMANLKAQNRAHRSSLMMKCSAWMVALCGFLYLITSIFGYIRFGKSIDNGDLLSSYQQGAPFFQTLRILFAIAISCHYPIFLFATRHSIELSFFKGMAFNWYRHFAVTFFLVASTVAVAIAVPNLEKLFAFTGAVAAYPLCFIFPAVFFLRAYYDRLAEYAARGPNHTRLSSGDSLNADGDGEEGGSSSLVASYDTEDGDGEGGDNSPRFSPSLSYQNDGTSTEKDGGGGGSNFHTQVEVSAAGTTTTMQTSFLLPPERFVGISRRDFFTSEQVARATAMLIVSFLIAVIASYVTFKSLVDFYK